MFSPTGLRGLEEDIKTDICYLLFIYVLRKNIEDVTNSSVHC